MEVLARAALTSYACAPRNAETVSQIAMAGTLSLSRRRYRTISMPLDVQVRRVLRWQLKDYPAFRAFIQDYLPEVAWRIPEVVDRMQAENMLLCLVPSTRILLCLEERRRVESSDTHLYR